MAQKGETDRWDDGLKMTENVSAIADMHSPHIVVRFGIRPDSVRSGQFTTLMVTNEKQKILVRVYLLPQKTIKVGLIIEH